MKDEEYIKKHWSDAELKLEDANNAIEGLVGMGGTSNAVKSIAASNLVIVEYLHRIDEKLDLIEHTLLMRM